MYFTDTPKPFFANCEKDNMAWIVIHFPEPDACELFNDFESIKHMWPCDVIYIAMKAVKNNFTGSHAYSSHYLPIYCMKDTQQK